MRQLLTADELAQRPDRFEIASGSDLQKHISLFAGRRRFRVDDHDRAILAAAKYELPRWIDRIALEMPRMTFYRIGAPKNYQVGSIAHLAERTSRFAHLLDRHDRWTVAHRSGRVDVGTELIGQTDRGALAVGAAA